MPDKIPEALLRIIQEKDIKEGWTVSHGIAKERLRNGDADSAVDFDESLAVLDEMLEALKSIDVNSEERHHTIEGVIDDVDGIEEGGKEMLRVFLRDQSKGIDLAIQNMGYDEEVIRDFSNAQRGVIGGLLQEMIDALEQHVAKE